MNEFFAFVQHFLVFIEVGIAENVFVEIGEGAVQTETVQFYHSNLKKVKF